MLIAWMTVTGDLAAVTETINDWIDFGMLQMEYFEQLCKPRLSVWGVHEFAIIAKPRPAERTELQFLDVKELYLWVDIAWWNELKQLFEAMGLFIGGNKAAIEETYTFTDAAYVESGNPILPNKRTWKKKRAEFFRHERDKAKELHARVGTDVPGRTWVGTWDDEYLKWNVEEEWNTLVRYYDEKIAQIERWRELWQLTTKDATARYLSEHSKNPSQAEQTRKSSRWGDTDLKLDTLRKLRADNIRKGKVYITKSKACQRVGIDLKTANSHAPTLMQRWYDAEYKEE